MISTLKSELRKFVTVRSSYIVTTLVLIASVFFAVYVFGYQSAALPSNNPLFLREAVYNVIGLFVTLAAILAILQVAHEYRYNMITYTLTASPSRTRIFFAKLLVLLGYATIMGVIVGLIGYFGAQFGAHLAGKEVVAQDFSLWSNIWRFGLTIWGYVLAGFIIAMLIRGVVGSIVAFLLIPTVEQISSLLLKGNTKYLPFRALDAIGANGPPEGIDWTTLGYRTAALVFIAYIIVVGSLALAAFVKRDAN